jgi:hypothetical protein
MLSSRNLIYINTLKVERCGFSSLLQYTRIISICRYREAEDRQSSKFELFFDLLFVAVVHQMSDAAAESPTGLGLVKYILTFCPAFSIWSDVRDIMNQMGTDDVSQRFYILWIMALLAGYSINASSVELAVLGSSVGEGASVSETEERDASSRALQYAMAFFCVAKLSRVSLGFLYGFFIPHARLAIWVASANSALMCLLFFIAIFLPLKSLPALYTLVVLALVMEQFLKLGGVVNLKINQIILKRRQKASTARSSDSNGDQEKDSENSATDIEGGFSTAFVRALPRAPVYNIEHHVDRLGAFVTIVLGEMVANVFYTSTIATGVNA